jgi:hypothetical protein
MSPAIAWILGVVATVASGISTAAIIYIFKLIIRVEVLEKLFTDKKATLDAVKNSQDDLDRRVTRVEDAVVAIKEIVPELKKLGMVAQRLELLFEVKDGRIEDLETKVFGK